MSSDVSASLLDTLMMAKTLSSSYTWLQLATSKDLLIRIAIWIILRFLSLIHVGHTHKAYYHAAHETSGAYMN